LRNILIVHNRYRQPGGEDAVVEAEASLLRAHGHHVSLLEVGNDDVRSSGHLLRTAIEAPYSLSMRSEVSRRIRESAADIVHAHNTFPRISPSIYDACAAAQVPVVQTLHNYRLLCPAATMVREGAICERCATGLPVDAVRFGCYRSRPESLVAAATVALHRARGTWRTRVSGFIALTQFARAKFVAAGLPADRVFVKPNFSPAMPASPMARRREALFVGRLSEEKGLRTLIEAWRRVEWPLRVIGDGPLASELAAIAPAHVAFEGWRPATDARRAMEEASFLILPSEWYEGLPMVVVEAFARGLPVVASRIGGLPELVRDGWNGVLVEPRDARALAERVNELTADPQRLIDMGAAARSDHAARFSPASNYHMLAAIYDAATDAAGFTVEKRPA
jgi:glycosyltransferase involved in cell wall biosynthesis